ncbi:hypothetical protein [Streptomyces sp. NPDC127084]|uniref:hypothetical protein n=1 Tax=Streptomyces sp. NPDC127084 TaxID=3347133 RepID=UPI00366A0AA9
MSIRRTGATQRLVATVWMAAVLTLTLSACGGDQGKESDEGAPSAPSPSERVDAKGDAVSGEGVDRSVKIAEMKGRGGLVLVINEIKRDSGGFVTVNGEIRNTGDGIRDTGGWAGAESAVVAANPNSVAGATLVDRVGKKRYYILRDTDGRCLCTTGILPINAGKVAPVFMQFPAPPGGTVEVDFTLPTFASATLKMDG